jgi:Flp pilus assembly protein TadG
MLSRNASSRDKTARRGMVVALVALLLPVIVGVMALAVDAGLLYLQRRQAQSAADAAALAGSYTMYNTSNFTQAQSAAVAIGTQNGFTITNVNVTQPKSTQIAVTVTSNPPRFFSALWGSGGLTISASATAQSNSSSSGTTPYSTSGVILLDSSASGSLSLAGSAKITASAGIQVNSNSKTAVNANNAGTTASPLNIVGGYTTSSGGTLTGTVSTGVTSVGNPLSSISAPSIPAATTTPLSKYIGYGSYTMQPGLYAGGVSLGNGGTFTMEPGLYYIQGGNFTVANGATLTGSGVTIYIDGTNVSGTSSPGSISFQGGTTTTLSAPSSSSNGAIQGMVYYQNSTSTTSPSFANGTNVNLTGTFYAAAAPLTFAGGNLSNFASQVVVDSMNLSNDAQITIDYSSSTVAAKVSSYTYPVALVQ